MKQIPNPKDAAGTLPDLRAATRLEWYRRMFSIRSFEMEIIALNKTGLIPGTAHLYIGMEAIAVGACAAMKVDDDRVFVASSYPAIVVGRSVEIERDWV